MSRSTSKVTETLALSDFLETSQQLSHQSLRLFTKALDGNGTASLDMQDPLKLGNALLELSAEVWTNPMKLANAQAALWFDFVKLSQRMTQRMFLGDVVPVIEPEQGDRRFRDDGWDEHVVFDMIKQGYLLTARAWIELVTDFEALDEGTREKLSFSIGQMVDALSPSNFAATNPEVMRATVDSGGRNLLQGLNNLLDDLNHSSGPLDIKMTDRDAFEVGVDLATTPGKVIYQNDLLQLIQYAPATEKVFQQPLLIIPPWMNKYYVLDLGPDNSMVRWLVEQGHTVFVVSWVNPDQRLKDKGFEHYLLEGPLAALDAIEKATGEREINVIGYCLGGILLAAAMAYLAAKGDDRVKSATYLTTMVDFSDVGDVGLFVNGAALDELEEQIHERGYLSGQQIATTFRTIRANDLIWSFFVNSYLLGKSPAPFDILYWNSDSTNMPAAMHTFFMRNMYLENRLREPGGIMLAGVPIDVGRVTTPAFILSAKEDHIAPWKTTYVTNHLFSGPVEFVLSASGHIAGVINPPHKDKYGYWTNAAAPEDADDWLAGATEHKGSWWPAWARWVAPFAGKQVPARNPGDGELEPIEDAPGSYVTVRI